MIKGGTKNFEYFYFYLGSYSCVRRLEVIVGKNIKQQTCKPVVCMFYLTTHRFLSGVQSQACTTYGKCLLESIMVVITPEIGY